MQKKRFLKILGIYEYSILKYEYNIEAFTILFNLALYFASHYLFKLEGFNVGLWILVVQGGRMTEELCDGPINWH